jgi:hypothetical protein
MGLILPSSREVPPIDWVKVVWTLPLDRVSADASRLGDGEVGNDRCCSDRREA